MSMDYSSSSSSSSSSSTSSSSSSSWVWYLNGTRSQDMTYVAWASGQPDNASGDQSAVVLWQAMDHLFADFPADPSKHGSRLATAQYCYLCEFNAGGGSSGQEEEDVGKDAD